MDSPSSSSRHLKLRVKLCSFAALGPGKASLLEAVERCGSITAAAKDQGMSYRRAWMLIDEMNRAFRLPVVGTVSGGAAGGGTRLTDLGREVVSLYREVQNLAETAVAEPLRRLEALVADNPEPPVTTTTCTGKPRSSRGDD
ncbi:winged helix-turn-helix domain-containing protein [Magnetospirillum sp. SS-4]|uniref:winged helix-turn-helix domain-containing protein n=1 Tax=Magnetospirillum sp. SS-4 TaxID=2681465 RepID=UPI00137D6ED2|nr:winged helix-turn-helix domain-containing protein [Magnetospirillum sp. SS-4]CAA7619929.1 ModE family transcriptional regulator [Magnetospirillum sp. SS-4]